VVPKIPAGLKQEYVFMPSWVRDAYLLSTLRVLMENEGRQQQQQQQQQQQHKSTRASKGMTTIVTNPDDDNNNNSAALGKARSAIVFCVNARAGGVRVGTAGTSRDRQRGASLAAVAEPTVGV
jgi:hypothetical protein